MVPQSENESELIDLIEKPGYYIYPGEIESITMLGDGKELEWKLTEGEGLKIAPPKTKPCEHAFVFKIERKNKFIN